MTIGINRQPGLDVPRRTPINMPARGLYVSIPGLFLDPQFSPRCNNIRFFGGEVLHRPGTIDFPPGPVTLDNIPNSGALHEPPDGSTYTLIATSTSIYYWTAAPTWTSANTYFGFPGFGGSTTDPWSFAAFDQDICFSQGVDQIWRWRSPSDDLGNGVGQVALLSNSFPARYLASFAGRIIAARTVESAITHGDRIRWSAQEDITTWDPNSNATAGFLDTVDLPGEITGMRTLRDANYIFKREGIIRMLETGLVTPSFAFQTAIEGVGCLSGATLVRIGPFLYFLGNDNVYVFDGTQLQPIGDAIRTQLFELLNRNALRQCFAFYHDTFSEYWLCIAKATETWPSIAYVYNTRDNAWTRHDFDATCHTRHRTQGTPTVINDVLDIIDNVVTAIDAGIGGDDTYVPIIGRTDSRAYKIDDTTISDGGVAVTASWDSADTQLSEPGRQATLHRVVLTVRDRGSGANIEVLASIDGGINYTSLGTQSAPVGATNRTITLTYPTRLNAEHVRIRVETPFAFALQRIVYEIFDREEFK